MKGSAKKVLYLSHDGLTDPLGQSQILPYLCGLSPEFDITIVSFEKKERFMANRLLIQKICDENKLRWVPLSYHRSPPVLATLYDIRSLRKKVMALDREHHFNLVHCRSYITSLVGLWLKKKTGAKYIFDMRGFWADERVDGGLWNLSNPVFKRIYSFFKRKEKDFLSQADRTVVLTENAKKEILQWGITKRITVIPCCVDMKHFDYKTIDRTKRDSLRQSLGLSTNDFVLLYLGSLGTWYMTAEMLSFFSALKSIKPSARFLILTPDKLNIDDNPFKNDIIIRTVSRNEVPTAVSLANLSIMFIKPVFSKKASSATKMGELLAMGVPVITNEGWGDIEIFKGDVPGLLTLGISDSYEVALTKISLFPSPEDIRSGAAEKFSLVNGVSAYRAVYRDLI